MRGMRGPGPRSVLEGIPEKEVRDREGREKADNEANNGP